MFEHFKGEEAFVKKILEFKDQALNRQRIVLTKFLNPYYQSIVYSVIGKLDELIVLEDDRIVTSLASTSSRPEYRMVNWISE